MAWHESYQKNVDCISSVRILCHNEPVTGYNELNMEVHCMIVNCLEFGRKMASEPVADGMGTPNVQKTIVRKSSNSCACDSFSACMNHKNCEPLLLFERFMQNSSYALVSLQI